MSIKNEPLTSENTRMLMDSRESVRAIQFFVSAIAAQLKDMDVKLDAVELATTQGEFEEKLARVERERDDGRQQIAGLTARLKQLEQEAGKLQEELVRQHVTFADHHAAKQEIARLRGELEALRQRQTIVPEQKGSNRRWWQFGRS